MILFLPFPPTVNTYWRSVRVRQGSEMVTRVLISERGRQYRGAVHGAILEQLKAYPKTMNGWLEVHLWACPPDKRRRDLDNLPKAVFDACTHSRVWGDDSQIQKLTIEWWPAHIDKPTGDGGSLHLAAGNIALKITPASGSAAPAPG